MSQRQIQSKKNVFGLVSKLGSFIKGGKTISSLSKNNIDTQKKNYNIHLSEDNQEIFQIGDEEEEEEEEEENEIKENLRGKKILENMNEDEEKKEIKIKNEEKREETIGLYNIKSSKKNDNECRNINTENEIKEEIFDKQDENKEKMDEKNRKQEFLQDFTDTCHLYLKKGQDFNSSDIYCFPVIRKKYIKGLFKSFLKRQKYYFSNYLIFFVDCFIYLSKDVVVNKSYTSIRRINNIIKAQNLINFSKTRETEDKYILTLEILNKHGIKKTKELIIEDKYFPEINEKFKEIFKIYGKNFENK